MTPTRRALEIDPQLIPAWHNLAEVLDRVGRPLEADEARSEAIRLVGGGAAIGLTVNGGDRRQCEQRDRGPTASSIQSHPLLPPQHEVPG